MKKVLVTGGAGFIGSHIVESLLIEGYEVAIVDNFTSGKNNNINNLDVKIFNVDLVGEDLEAAIKEFNPTYIIHQAAQVSVAKSVENIVEDTEINILGSVNLIKYAAKYSVEKIIFASSAAVYGEPVNIPISISHQLQPQSPYGLSKFTVEKYLQLCSELYGIDYTILRYSNVYGPRQDIHGEGGVIAIFADKISKSQDIYIYGDGTQTRDFIFVKDVARANVQALTRGSKKILNVSSNTNISVNELVKMMKDNVLTESHTIYKDVRTGDIKHSCLCNEDTITILDWYPEKHLEQGLIETINYYKALELV